MASTDVSMIDLSAAIREFDNLEHATMDVVRQILAAKRELSKIAANDGATHQNNEDATMTDHTEPVPTLSGNQGNSHSLRSIIGLARSTTPAINQHSRARTLPYSSSSG